MTSEIPLSTTVWRISPSDFLAVLLDADSQLESSRRAYVESQLNPYQTRIRRASGVDSETLAAAEASLRGGEERLRAALAPRWYLVTKRGRTDTPEGSIEAIAPMIDVPDRYVHMSVSLRGGGTQSIDLTLTSSGPTITIRGTDKRWLQQTERWAQEVLKAHRLRWWWLMTTWGFVAALVAAAGVAVASAALLPLAGVPDKPAQLLGLGVAWCVIILMPVLVFRFQAPIVNPGPPRSRNIAVQALLLIVGGVFGVIITRLADSLVPV